VQPDPGSAQLRDALLAKVQQGLDADRQNGAKWDPLYQWFHDALGVGSGARGGDVVAKVITEPKQIGNRIDEMAKSNPRYAVISLTDIVTADAVLRFMRQRASLGSLRCILFLQGTEPHRFIVFDD
jgi:hypothetical protein